MGKKRKPKKGAAAAVEGRDEIRDRRKRQLIDNLNDFKFVSEKDDVEDRDKTFSRTKAAKGRIRLEIYREKVIGDGGTFIVNVKRFQEEGIEELANLVLRQIIGEDLDNPLDFPINIEYKGLSRDGVRALEDMRIKS